MSITAKCLAVVQLPVYDLERSVAWYQEVLGLTLAFEFKAGDNEAWLNVNGPGFGLIRCRNVPNMSFCNMKGEPQPLVQFETEDIHQVREKLIERGVDVSEMKFKEEGGYSFNFTDPDSHILNLWGGWLSTDHAPKGQ